MALPEPRDGSAGSSDRTTVYTAITILRGEPITQSLAELG